MIAGGPRDQAHSASSTGPNGVDEDGCSTSISTDDAASVGDEGGVIGDTFGDVVDTAPSIAAVLVVNQRSAANPNPIPTAPNCSASAIYMN